MSSFLKKAKNSLNDAKEIGARLEAMGIDKAKMKSTYASFTGKPSTAPSTEKEVVGPSSVPASAVVSASAPTEKETATATPSSTTASSFALTPATTATPSVTPSTAPNAPTKLSLSAKKSIRDDFESKREGFEASLSKDLGTPWKFFYDAPGIYSYSAGKDFPQQNPGLMLESYFRSAVEYVGSFIKEFGADGAAQLNTLAPSHTITLEPSSDTSITYCDCDLLHGALVVLFREDQLGTNSDLACKNLIARVNAAAAASAANVPGATTGDTVDLVARQSIKAEWEPQVADLTNQARKYLQAPTLTLVPNFEANYATLRAWEAKGNKPSQDRWNESFGPATVEYFKGFNIHLEIQGFDKDDMLQEGFKESVERNEVVLRVVEVLSPGARTSHGDNNRYQGAIIEGGTLYIETLASSWWSNALQATDRLMELL